MLIHVYTSDRPQTLRLDVADIEHAICRCGWMILNDAEDITEADRAEIARIEAQGYAESETLPAAEALAWWRARLVA